MTAPDMAPAPALEPKDVVVGEAAMPAAEEYVSPSALGSVALTEVTLNSGGSRDDSWVQYGRA